MPVIVCERNCRHGIRKQFPLTKMAFGNLALEPKKQNDQHERERESKKEQKRGIAKLST